MTAPILENNHVKLSLLDLSNYEHLTTIAKEKNLVQYFPSNISTSEDLKNYLQTAVDEYYHHIAIPFIIYDKG